MKKILDLLKLGSISLPFISFKKGFAMTQRIWVVKAVIDFGNGNILEKDDCYFRTEDGAKAYARDMSLISWNKPTTFLVHKHYLRD